MKRKLFALLLALAFLLPCLSLGTSAAASYTIGNPYASVDWDTWKAYKTQLHVHTNGSDGELPLNELVEEHYRLNYDILAITDHMTLGVPWNQAPRTVPIMRLVKYSRTKMAPMAPLTDARRQEILTGVGRGNRPMLEITRGVELNGAVPSNSHLQGWFSDFGQGFIGVDMDWETPIKRAQKAGGLTSLNHVGEPAGAEESGDPAYYDKNPKWVDKFAYLFVKYPSCLIGMDVNSGTNDGTKFDIILYDRILAKVIPHGVLPWAFTYSDAHSPGQFDRAFTLHMMPELTEAALRTSMEDGAFFGFARHARLDKGDAFEGKGDPPKVSRIAVDQAAGTITVTAAGYDTIVWVSDGVEVSRGNATLDIAAHDAKIGSYVRAYLLGPSGILYIQPFTVLRAGQTLPKQDIPRVLDYSIPLSWVSAAANILFNYTPLWLVKAAMVLFDPYVDLPWIPWGSLIGG
ncbi:MAG: hypothetical protein FWC27_07790 [Firmicutes bacterium]|nr:hypothetical protein [Bacillota bacterium]